MHAPPMHDFRRLQVWHLASEVVARVDTAVRAFPPQDRGVVAAQLRRAALSIPTNIAEGCGKGSRRETLRYLQIASGSVNEVESHLLIAERLGYIHPRRCQDLLNRTGSVRRMLLALMRKLPDQPVV